MFKKRKSTPPRVSGESPRSRARRSYASVLLDGSLSGPKWAKVLQDLEATSVGLDELFAKAPLGVKNLKNIQRNILTYFGKKQGQWPAFYSARIPFWDPRAEAVTHEDVPILLPHLVVEKLAKTMGEEAIRDCSGLDAHGLRELRRMQDQLQIAEGVVPLGLWGDSVPFTWDKKGSLQIIALSLPGQEGVWADFRCVLSVWPKAFTCEDTIPEVLKVLAWSFQHCAAGHHPTSRHTGEPFHSKKDKELISSALQALPARSLLMELRADWSYLKEAFGVPQWNEAAGACFLCGATPATMSHTGPEACWRTQRLDHMSFISRQLRQGVRPSIIWDCPGLQTTNIRIDWLHTMDLGVTKSFAGGFVSYIVTLRLLGPREARFKLLNDELQMFYTGHPLGLTAPSRLDNMNSRMLQRKNGGAPQLFGRAAQIRGLVPWLVVLAEKYLGRRGTDLVLKEAAETLQLLYSNLSSDAHLDNASLSQKMANLLKTLAEVRPQHFGLRPKVHFMQELLEYSAPGSKGSSAWTYRDEDFGGYIVRLAHAEGGPMRPAAMAQRTLRRFLALEGDLPATGA